MSAGGPFPVPAKRSYQSELRKLKSEWGRIMPSDTATKEAASALLRANYRPFVGRNTGLSARPGRARELKSNFYPEQCWNAAYNLLVPHGHCTVGTLLSVSGSKGDSFSRGLESAIGVHSPRPGISAFVGGVPSNWMACRLGTRYSAGGPGFSRTLQRHLLWPESPFRPRDNLSDW